MRNKWLQYAMFGFLLFSFRHVVAPTMKVGGKVVRYVVRKAV